MEASELIGRLKAASEGGRELDEAIELHFYPWLSEMASLAGYDSRDAMVADTGLCCWMDFFNEGYTPAQAWAEECGDD